MEGPGPVTTCSSTCGLQFGVYSLSSQDSQTLNLTKELNNLSINFQGPAGENQRILAKEKIKEIKQKVADYYYDSESKVIAIPNHFVTPKKPTVLGKEGKKIQDDQILDKYYEELLHHQIVNAARKSKISCFVMNGFQSGDCIQQLVQKGKEIRGIDETADFNEHEERMKKLLDIEELPSDKLELCIDEHLKWKEKKIEYKDAKNWLFKKECFINNANSFQGRY